MAAGLMPSESQTLHRTIDPLEKMQLRPDQPGEAVRHCAESRAGGNLVWALRPGLA